eukprot:276579_1
MGTCLNKQCDAHGEPEVDAVEQDIDYIETHQLFNGNSFDNPDLVIYLIEGYIRMNCKYVIHDVSNLCISFYGQYAQYLIYMKEHNEWCSTLSNNDFVTFPVTQYIDDNYQIAFVSHHFCCINMVTKEIYKLSSQRNVWDKRRKGDNLHLSMIPFINKIQTMKETVNSKIKWSKSFIWTDFESNLWNLFVMNHLYDETENIENQQIWRVIQLLFLIDFDEKQQKNLIIPKMILSPQYRPKLYFNGKKTPQNGTFITKKKLFLHEKKFNVNKDCNAKIIEYEKGKILLCSCYIYIDLDKD